MPYESALVGHARKEICLGIYGNHRDICRFGSENDPGYKAVVGALQDYIEAAGKQIRSQEPTGEVKSEDLGKAESLGKSEDVGKAQSPNVTEQDKRESGEYYGGLLDVYTDEDVPQASS